MSVIHPRAGRNAVHTVHRVGAAAVGGFLVLFAIVSLAQPLHMLSGPVVMGLSTSGFLVLASLFVGALLVTAAIRGGPTASTVSLAVGAVFLLSGVGNALVLDTAYNMLGFHLTNVIFSLAVGLALLVLGAYGRLTGSLPADSPYATPGPAATTPPAVDVTAAHSLAEAERAVVNHVATPIQLAGVAAAAGHRTHADRCNAFAVATHLPTVARRRSPGSTATDIREHGWEVPGRCEVFGPAVGG